VKGMGERGRSVKEAWGMLAGWLRHARRDSEREGEEGKEKKKPWVVKDGWGDELKEEEWRWLEEDDDDESEEEEEEGEGRGGRGGGVRVPRLGES